MIEACGYTYNPPPEVVPNSLKALEITELARDRDKHETVHTRLMDAYWSEAANIADETTLLSLAEQGGLDRSEAIEVLADGRYRQRIASATRDANLLGINAIPAFVLDDRLLLVGAYPHEVFERAFAQLEETEEETGS